MHTLHVNSSLDCLKKAKRLLWSGPLEGVDFFFKNLYQNIFLLEFLSWNFMTSENWDSDTVDGDAVVNF